MEQNRIEEILQKAAELHQKGYNCAQAVGCALAPLFGQDEASVFRSLEGFGFGMGNTRGVCGAVSGAVYAAGLLNSDGNLSSPATKRATYRLSGEILSRFAEKNQSLICHDLKGMDTGTPLRSCGGCIEDAVWIALQVLEPLTKEKKEGKL